MEESKIFIDSELGSPIISKPNKIARSVSFASAQESNTANATFELPQAASKIKTTKKPLTKEETKTNSQLKSTKTSPAKAIGNPKIKSRKTSPNKSPKIDLTTLLKPTTKKAK